MTEKKARPADAATEAMANEGVAAGEQQPVVLPAQTLTDPGMHADAGGNPRMSEVMKRHLSSHLNERDLMAAMAQSDVPVLCRPLTISLQNVRANSKASLIIRDDQVAMWSEGDGAGLVGLSFSTTRDPALYLRNYLINAREFYVQTYNTCQEILVNLYVRTAQPGFRGRVDLPPGAVATLQSNTERVSLVGLSAFAIDF
ncbi:hypothetical protein EO087_14310 [Dyella sp. M7H15-1]|uniref:hypothetical protein n=1 Tax=Dyella sp. M7H15-1 TaxID=2501295 RepID=UPI0010052632|nr:hypothetical protein [Dyella sp. M7H15-1]QAU25022.1 hypothetical protein EO087_14310 [Dyella sp. M7H15-1]